MTLRDSTHGNYLIFFPTPIDDFSTVRGEIQDRLLEYIRDTRSLENASWKVVYEKTASQQRPQQCMIQKVNNKLNRVSQGGPVWAKWEGEATIDVCGLLDESIKTKCYNSLFA